MLGTNLQIRTALLHDGLQGPVRFDGEYLVCTVAYQRVGGAPVCAMLVPMENQSNGKWQAAAGDGKSISTTLDLPRGDSWKVNSASHTVDIRLRWPEGATHALLLLMHEQPRFSRDPRGRGLDSIEKVNVLDIAKLLNQSLAATIGTCEDPKIAEERAKFYMKELESKDFNIEPWIVSRE